MAEVTRFPHYHQVENVVTNHVMVMLRTLYESSPKLFEGLLQALCTDEVAVGPRFSQQVAGAHSIPDGLILQEPLAVFVETKLGSVADSDQLQRHCRTIVERLRDQKGSFLISLTAGQVRQSLPADVVSMAQAHGITVVPVTFEQLVTQLSELPGLDMLLKSTVQEFADFIFAQRLIPRGEQIMVAVLTGKTWRDNLVNRIYYEPADRTPKWLRAAYLGLYHDKQISHVGRITAAVCALRDDNGSIIFENPEIGQLSDEHRHAVRDAIQAAQSYYPDFEYDRHRYYLVDEFTLLEFRKVSPGGMMGHRYFDIEEISGRRLPLGATGVLVSQALNGRTFS